MTENDDAMILGPIRCRQEGDIHHVENEFIQMAFVYTDDHRVAGTARWHGPEQVWVEYIKSSTP